MTAIRSICVYCGSASGMDPTFASDATALGRAMADAGIRLIYGGGNIGLMGTVARAVLEAGGEVTGVIPTFLKDREILLEEAQETIVVPDMHSRKQIMYERADAFIALPGGIGTLEELVEQLTWSQLGRHTKPILLLNTQNFWQPLLDLFAHMSQSGFIRPGLEVRYLVADNARDAITQIEAAVSTTTPREDAAIVTQF
ncbi:MULTISPECIES: TIGR00730 family Rossman fold protein [unclassified Chelatococcus]|uniref:LOG family protein n=1 Tax=unclassified Chelatococcus TaxID=2638111 RepID=UPI001BCC2523|nr:MULTISPECIES: TIGR00730 family Rossman fold protein [unclassified Chelatococcus]MBS7739214.1 TIGR00730 family Rossman fold protein [Chelatococcus sp. HY11]MBX3543704.1 TIGR00730 family Rossman fold protein [Chelatococcus sp.]MCO5076253.1 TIGR00730 family Rossman fold protein [Chelatococcus sp.]